MARGKHGLLGLQHALPARRGEGIQVEQLLERHLGVPCRHDAARRVRRAHSRAHLVELRSAHEVDLVEDRAVGKRELLLGLGSAAHERESGRGRPQVAHDVLRVDHRDDAVEEEGRVGHLVPPQHLQDRPNVGEAARLDEHVVDGERA